MTNDSSYALSKEQQLLLSTVLKEYLNIGDWKGLFAKTNSEEFAQKNTQFYNEDSWENGSLEENLDKDCAASLAFILDKDCANLKTIWEIPGVKTMAQRKDENFHDEIEALISNAENSKNSNAITDLIDQSQGPFDTLKNAEECLKEKKINDAFLLTHASLFRFLQQSCANYKITTDETDSITILLSKISNHIKQQSGDNLNDTSLLRTATLIAETIDDSQNQNIDENHFKKADVQYVISISRSVMVYIDDLMA